MISLASGEEEERTCVGCSSGRPSIIPASNDYCHCLSGQTREEEDDDFVGPGGGADKVTAALRPSADGTTSNRMVDKATEGAKEKAEERRSGVVWEDKERWLAVARAGGGRCDEHRATRERGGRRRTQ